MLSGVCNGLAAYFGVDVTLVRVMFVVFSVLTGGIGVAVYLVMMIVVPVAVTAEQMAAGARQTLQCRRADRPPACPGPAHRRPALAPAVARSAPHVARSATAMAPQRALARTGRCAPPPPPPYGWQGRRIPATRAACCSAPWRPACMRCCWSRSSSPSWAPPAGGLSWGGTGRPGSPLGGHRRGVRDLRHAGQAAAHGQYYGHVGAYSPGHALVALIGTVVWLMVLLTVGWYVVHHWPEVQDLLQRALQAIQAAFDDHSGRHPGIDLKGR